MLTKLLIMVLTVMVESGTMLRSLLLMTMTLVMVVTMNMLLVNAEAMPETVCHCKR